MATPHTVLERIRGRMVEIEVGKVEGVAWVAVGIVRQGLPHEEGMRFEARATTREDAEAQLAGKIEAYFA